ncbi:MAG: winged helix-turn-helix domain-containing protein [Alphaproteobacteria bacterium]|nr:winged helix-turn-helix domain-containing protein [Alphaproteobacteria bacterium]
MDPRYRVALYLPRAAPALAAALRALGCAVREAASLGAMEDYLRREAPDAILLGLSLQDSGAPLAQWRAQGWAAPALVLDAPPGTPVLRASGAWRGPPEPEAILAWLEARVAVAPPSPRVALQDGEVDLERREVRRAGGASKLTTTEARLLAALAARPGELRQRDWLLARIWGYRRGLDTRALDNAVMRLRHKIEVTPSKPRHVLTVRGAGFRFVPATRPAALAAPPLLLDRLHGRGAELACCAEALREAHILTLLGPGGVGKTRLARELAARWEGEVAWVDLRAVSTRETLEERVLEALDAEGGAVEGALSARSRLLLVLDPFDPLTEAAPALSRWAGAAPRCRILVTSRRRLRAHGERCVPVEPLELPAAVSLYLDRARALRPRLSPAVVDTEALVERLDRLPLAIELAAARADVLPPGELLRALDEAPGLLAAAVGADPQHCSLRATLAWSWQLLEEPARRDLVRCAMFEAPFSLEDAAAVLGCGAPAAAARLEALVERSLLRGEGDPRRYSTLGTLRRFVLEESGAEAALAAQAHARWARGQARTLLLPFAWPRRPRPAELRRRLGPELDALAARQGASVSPEVSLARALLLDSVLDLAGALRLLGPEARGAAPAEPRLCVAWLQLLLREAEVLGATPERRARLRALLEAPAPSASPLERAHLALSQARLARLEGDFAGSLEPLARALAEAEHEDAPALQTVALWYRGHGLRILGREAEAEAAMRRALACAERSGVTALFGRALHQLGLFLSASGAQDEAEALLAEALRVFRQQGSRAQQALVLSSQAAHAAVAGRVAEAEAIAEAARPLLEAHGLLDRASFLDVNLGQGLLFAGRPGEARAHLARAEARLEGHPEHWAAQNLRLAQLLEDLDAPGADAALEQAEATLSPMLRPLLLELRGLRALGEGRLMAAEAHLSAAIDASGRDPRVAALPLLGRAAVRRRQGARAAALADARAAWRALSVRGLPPAQVHALLRLAELVEDPDERLALCRRAAARAQALDSGPLETLARFAAARVEGRPSTPALPSSAPPRLRALLEDLPALSGPAEVHALRPLVGARVTGWSG